MVSLEAARRGRPVAERSLATIRSSTTVVDPLSRRVDHGAVPSRPRDRQRGYVSVELTAERLTAHLRTVSDVAIPCADALDLRSFVVEAGRPGAVPA